jgi:hypothetical protein
VNILKYNTRGTKNKKSAFYRSFKDATFPRAQDRSIKAVIIAARRIY